MAFETPDPYKPVKVILFILAFPILLFGAGYLSCVACNGMMASEKTWVDKDNERIEKEAKSKAATEKATKLAEGITLANLEQGTFDEQGNMTLTITWRNETAEPIEAVNVTLHRRTKEGTGTKVSFSHQVLYKGAPIAPGAFQVSTLPINLMRQDQSSAHSIEVEFTAAFASQAEHYEPVQN